jgi:CelD/BcsL family acetyltransferase involved in cellulose biosynthesis
MSTHPEWSTPTFDLAPIAPMTGPFPGRDWLRCWWDHRGIGEVVLADAGDSLVPLTLYANRLQFAGEADLTDYHSPLGGTDVAALAKVVGDLPPGTELNLDSLPEEAATGVAAALNAAGVATTREQHNVTAVLDLPDSFEEYLAGLAKKERHELRRKRRRFDNELGTGTVERRSGADAVALFARLHRLSAGDKGAFMTAAMEKFFLALHREAGGVIDILIDGSGRPASAIFSFEDATGFYLYNSAFEPELRQHSPGNVMLSHLIERAIGKNLKVFDFLKGDETYKFRLGAQPRPLYVVAATIGADR